MNKAKLDLGGKNAKQLIVVAVLAVMAVAIQWLVASQSMILAEAQDKQLALEKDLADCRAGNAPAAPEINSETKEDNATAVQDLPPGETKAENGILAPEKAAKAAVDYINRDLLADGATATSDYKASEVSGVYKFNIEVSGKDYDTYITKDGKIVFAQAHFVTSADEGKSKQSENITDSGKTDKPDVKLFVMSYCPYGLQAEKMYLPVYDLLKGKANMGIYFVDYAMHGQKELDENLRQYCVQKEQNDKYSAYLKCFTGSQPGTDGTGTYDACLASAKIDKTKLAACIAATDKQYGVTAGFNDKVTWVSGQFPKFTVNGDLNTQYGVQGSPTVVINGKQVSVSPRSPQNFLKTVCGAFASPPAECSTSLSTDAVSTGFGGGTSTGSSGGCGG